MGPNGRGGQNVLLLSPAMLGFTCEHEGGEWDLLFLKEVQDREEFLNLQNPSFYILILFVLIHVYMYIYTYIYIQSLF